MAKVSDFQKVLMEAKRRRVEGADASSAPEAPAWSEAAWSAASGWSAADAAWAPAWDEAGAGAWSQDGWAASAAGDGGWSAADGGEAWSAAAAAPEAKVPAAAAEAKVDKDIAWLEDVLAEDAKAGGKKGKGGGKGEGKKGKKGPSGIRTTGSLTDRVSALNGMAIWRNGINAVAMGQLRALPEVHAHKVLDQLDDEAYDAFNPSRLIEMWADRIRHVPIVEVADRPAVLRRIKEMAARGENALVLNAEAKSALFRADPKGALAALSALDDRAEMPDPSGFVLQCVTRQEQATKDEAVQLDFRADPALFKLRFIEALRVESAKEDAFKGKKGKKGDGKGKAKGGGGH